MTEYFKCLACGRTTKWANRTEGFCKVCYESTNTVGEKKTVKIAGDVTISEMTRLQFQPIRRLMLKELQKHIRSNPEEMKPVEMISDKEFSSPLTPFLKE